MRSAYFVALLILLQVSSSSAQVVRQSPSAVVAALVAQDTGGWGKVFAEKPTSIMRRYFTNGFNSSWAKAMTHNQQEPVLDGDPITGFQSVTRVKINSTEGGETGPTTARVVAKLTVNAGGKPEAEQVVFDLKIEGRLWKVDDITSGTMQPIRSYFRKSYNS